MNRLLTRRIVLGKTLAAGLVLVLPGVAGCRQPGNPSPPIDPAAPPSSDPAIPPNEGNSSSGLETGTGSYVDKSADARVNSVDDQPAPQPPKISQLDAKYQNQPNGKERCGNCAQFLADTETCKVVEGKVQTYGWFYLYAASKA